MWIVALHILYIACQGALIWCMIISHHLPDESLVILYNCVLFPLYISRSCCLCSTCVRCCGLYYGPCCAPVTYWCRAVIKCRFQAWLGKEACDSSCKEYIGNSYMYGKIYSVYVQVASDKCKSRLYVSRYQHALADFTRLLLIGLTWGLMQHMNYWFDLNMAIYVIDSL